MANIDKELEDPAVRLKEGGYNDRLISVSYKYAKRRTIVSVLNTERQPTKDVIFFKLNSLESKRVKLIINQYLPILFIDSSKTAILKKEVQFISQKAPNIGNNTCKRCRIQYVGHMTRIS